MSKISNEARESEVCVPFSYLSGYLITYSWHVFVTGCQTTYRKATQAELAKNYDSAFRLYIKSAEGYLHLSRSVPGASEPQKNKWKEAADKALGRAEKIKSVADRQREANAASGSTPAAVDYSIRLTPVTVNPFSPHEQFLVLTRGEKVDGRVYPPWDDVVQPDECVVKSHVDAQPPFSAEQLRQDPEWRRPSVESVVTSARQILPEEILQNIVTDCSLCASLIVCLEHGKRFKSHAKHGRYHVRMLFNGTWRRVIIDDRLPYSRTSNTLLCMSVRPLKHETTRQVIWPSLIEKAYMKLMGGYEFPGSFVLYLLIRESALAGWIPESLNTKSPSFEREKTWTRLLKGFLSGQCVITFGTGSGRHCSWHEIKLLPEHCYAVVDVAEDGGGPVVTILNSLAQDVVEEFSRLMRVPWSDAISTFDEVCISWNPDIWPKNLKFHGLWKRGGEEEQSSTTRLSLLFSDVSPDNYIWILLTRHFSDVKRSSDFISLRAELEDVSVPVSNSVAQQTLTEKGTFTNCNHVLAKVRVSSSSGVLCITACYDGDASDVGYTIDVYASQRGSSFSWDENVSSLLYKEKIQGAFTTKNSGGNGTYPTFMLNPQYHLRIHPPRTGSRLLSVPNPSRQKVKTSIVLKTERNIPVNISLAWSQGERLFVLSEEELVASSGPYSYGLSTITNDIMPGDYSLIISPFEPHHLGSFSCSVSSSAPFDLRPIPQEGAGLYRKVVKGAWYETVETAGGSPSFDKYASNPIYLIESPSQFNLKVRLQLTEPLTTPSLNVTIYPASSSVVTGEQFKQKYIATSGPYDDAICGVATPQVSLSAGKYWVVPSTYLPGVKAEFSLVVYASVRDVVVMRGSERI
ncbi:hypothetical protein M378DRAFT_90149 [Amanita muscaria Koide BX008]|uniref:Calpain catalytic domain-containing protein n=1 Tax=Amanita muscaria (strain Koide BX008) TaxID=946122 RepID=A0A0C2WGV8_AMAMK|nr:hypothetical protein M378DRAFT_90149 [Amanita muscaria Koide BX008]